MPACRVEQQPGFSNEPGWRLTSFFTSSRAFFATILMTVKNSSVLKHGTAPETAFAFLAPITVATGDGSFLVKAGKPTFLLSAKQLGSHFSVDQDTVYLWRQGGLIPESFVRFAGKRKLRFSSDIIPFLEAEFRKLRE
jgi:hypothetical protein